MIVQQLAGVFNAESLGFGLFILPLHHSQEASYRTVLSLGMLGFIKYVSIFNVPGYNSRSTTSFRFSLAALLLPVPGIPFRYPLASLLPPVLQRQRPYLARDTSPFRQPLASAFKDD
jgi:hypothetical protein